MKRKMIAGILALTLVIGLGACGSSGDGKEPESGRNPGTEQDADDNEKEEGEAASGGAIDAPEDEAGQSGQSGEGEGSQKPSTPKPPASQSGNQKPGGSGNGSATGGTTGGAAGGAENKAPISGSFEEIIKQIYETVGYDVNTSFTEVDADNAEYYLGSSGISFKKALASEPMMSSVAHSVVLLEASDDADLKDIKKRIKENVNGYKWVCVGVEAENILVGNVGNYVLLVMDEDSQSFMDAFLAMGK